MARDPNARILDTGDLFPELTLSLTDGTELTLPRDFKHPYNTVLLNRGAWCPYCVAQLRGFQAGLPKLAELGVGVVSLSAEPLAAAQAMVKENGLEFPVAYGAPIALIAGRLGAYYEPEPVGRVPHLHSAGFVLGTDNRILTAVYSSGAIGRLVAADVLGFVRYVKSHG